MADIPNPRSYSQIVAEMVDALLSRLGIPNLRVGSPALSIIEAAAQSDLRSSQDIFGLLNALDLDRASGLALDRIGADEEVERIGQGPSSGPVTITDTSFTKLSTRIYQGAGAPIVGSTSVNVEDALLFPASGQVYLGRGTANYEGPITYTSKVNAGTYWTLNLGTGTTRFHNLGEPVVLAQGGNRSISAGTLVRTPQGNAGTAVQFATRFSATIPDGETEVTQVLVECRVPGQVGNAVADSITEFVSEPFSGATVTNPAPFNNGLDTEDDQTYRERIRSVRQSRTQGTPLAIETGVTGVTALDENRRVLSSKLVRRQGEPATLYIDDGTGYEEKTEGIAFEAVVDNAEGGEQYFNLVQGRPVAKAFRQTTLQAPFRLEPDSRLSVSVGGVVTTHLFPASDFRALDNASAYEVVASINADPNLLWNARLADSGTRVSVFARADTNEDIEVQAVAAGLSDAATALGLSQVQSQSLWLYKNDRLLNKDGLVAALTTKPQGLWSSIGSGAGLDLEIDGIPFSITVTATDFVDAGTGYISVSQNNSLASWAAVLNHLLPGVTAAVSGSSLTLTSNSGRSNRASLLITGGSLSSIWFEEVSAQGASRDYTLDRNLGLIRLETGLSAGDRLTAGSYATRGFVETPAFTTLTVAAEGTSVTGDSGAEAWVVVDGGAALVQTGIGPGTSIAVSNPASPAWGKRVRYTGTATIFANAGAGDWLMATDLGFSQDNRGAYRIIDVDPGGTWVEIEQASTWAATQSAFSLISGGLRVVRTTAIPQRIFITSGSNYTALSLANLIQTQIQGATASTYRTRQVRIRSNSFSGGDIAVVAFNGGGQALGFPVSDAVASGISHLASVTASHPQSGTPGFVSYSVDTVASQSQFAYLAGPAAPSSGGIVHGVETLDDASGGRYGNKNHISSIEVRSGVNLTVRTPAVQHWLPGDRLYVAAPYSITARDQLALVLDQDETTHRFVVNAYRRVVPDSTTYGASNDFKDADNGSQSLAVAFGLDMDWKDFAVHMKARQKALGIMWRYYRHGPEGNWARVQYDYPVAASQATSVLESDTRTTGWVDIRVRLPSDAARTGYQLRNSSRVGMAVTSGPSGDNLYTYQYVLNLAVASAARVIRLNYVSRNATAFAGVVTGGTSGATAAVISDSNAGGSPAASGYIVVAAPVGTFVTGESLTDGGAAATSSSSQYGYTTLTLTLPGAVTDHGLQVGDTAWLQSTDVNFSTGSRVVLNRSATSISYADTATIVGATPSIGTISSDSGGEVTLTGSAAVAGDIFSVGSGTGFPSEFVHAIKTQALSGSDFSGESPDAGSVSTVLSWYPVQDQSLLSWYPLAAARTLANIVADTGSTGIVSGFVYGTPSNTIDYATYEAPPNGLGATDPWYYLVDGVNYVRSHSTPALPSQNYTFTFKDAVTAGLATNSDWANEDIRLVPITATNVVNYLNSPGVSGLFGAAEIAASLRGQAPQITTITGGSAGNIEVEGGGANSLNAAVAGSAAVVNTTKSAVSVLTSEAQGLCGGSWVALVNAVTAPKSIIGNTTTLATLSSSGWLELDAGSPKAWKYSANAVSAETLAQQWQIEKQGNFVAFIYNDSGSVTGFSGVQEGDWVQLSGAGLNSLNAGNFRVVRTETSTSTFWIENANAVEEVAVLDLRFLDYNSVLPGDTIIINTSLWDGNNLGTWTVAEIDASNQRRFRLDVSTRTPTAVSGPITLGSSSSLVQIYEGQPQRLIKQIQGIAPGSATGYTDLLFSTSAGYAGVGAAYGTVARGLDKLGFGIDASTGAVLNLAPGTDGYSHNTGLIAEVNKVVYGDESNSSAYPGIAAAGANININGPLFRRISVSLGLRIKNVGSRDVRTQVRSAVASVINKTPVGTPVSISALVTAAQSVNGVVAVTVLSPVYGSGSDLIPIQPYEKPLVIDIEQDIQISFIGE